MPRIAAGKRKPISPFVRNAAPEAAPATTASAMRARRVFCCIVT